MADVDAALRHVGPATVARATIAHKRLCGRYRRLAARGLAPHVINLAVTPELAGFLWAEMTPPAQPPKN